MNQSTNSKQREIRTVTAQEFRSSTTEQGTSISGTAIVYNSLSEDLGGFREKIAPGAARNSVTNNDILCFYNHDSGAVLGRTSAKTLTLREDDAGVHFECLLPNTSVGNDLKVSMDRGDVRACSFGFFVEKDDWKPETDGSWIRTVEQANVFEISIVSSPAYPATSASINRANFPDGIPAEVRAHLSDVGESKQQATVVEETRNTKTCGCECPECVAGNCDGCSNPKCDDDDCVDCLMSDLRTLRLRSRLVALNS